MLEYLKKGINKYPLAVKQMKSALIELAHFLEKRVIKSVQIPKLTATI